MRIVILPDGKARAIYDDRLVPVLEELGTFEIRRASHVEPGPGGWYADMSPVGGPKLGPFKLRKYALRAEEAWLRQRGF